MVGSLGREVSCAQTITLPIAGLELVLHIVEGEQLPMTLTNGIRLFVHGQDEAVQKENSQHVTSLGFLNSYAIDYYVRQIFACCISVRSDEIARAHPCAQQPTCFIHRISSSATPGATLEL